jgi:hypothetical protein
MLAKDDMVVFEKGGFAYQAARQVTTYGNTLYSWNLAGETSKGEPCEVDRCWIKTAHTDHTITKNGVLTFFQCSVDPDSNERGLKPVEASKCDEVRKLEKHLEKLENQKSVAKD